jgi:sporulation protein YlmC with PRC-barrel domain
MSRREIRLSDVVGRKVYDADGRSIGRVEELLAEIELHEHGNDYVVVEVHVGAYGALEALCGSIFARRLLRRVGRFIRHRHHRVPWTLMDFSDPVTPRVRCRESELPTASYATPISTWLS